MRQRTKHLIYAGLTGAVVAGLIFTSYVTIQSIHMKRTAQAMERSYKAELSKLEAEVQQQTAVTGWVPMSVIPAGHVIGWEKLEKVHLPSESVPADYVKTREEIMGKTAKISISPHTLLTESLLYQEEPTPDDLRLREMGFVQLPAVLRQGDVVDVRIQFPTGQDYILLSKKKLERLESGVVTVTLDETEILSLSSAIVDAYLHQASIYALTYVEPFLQHKSTPTYPPSDSVIQLMKKDPNIVQRAEQALNTASRTHLEQDLSSLSPGSSAEFSSYEDQFPQVTGTYTQEGGSDDSFVLGQVGHEEKEEEK